MLECSGSCPYIAVQATVAGAKSCCIISHWQLQEIAGLLDIAETKTSSSDDSRSSEDARRMHWEEVRPGLEVMLLREAYSSDLCEDSHERRRVKSTGHVI